MRPPLLTLFIVAASLLMGALVTIQVAGGRLDVTSKAWQMATMFDFAVFAGVALVLSADGSPHRAATRAPVHRLRRRDRWLPLHSSCFRSSTRPEARPVVPACSATNRRYLSRWFWALWQDGSGIQVRR